MDQKEQRSKVLRQEQNGYDRLTDRQRQEMDAYCADYITFLNRAKTERECVRESIRLAEAQGFQPYRRGMKPKAGDRLYRDVRGKMLLLAVIGESSLSSGAQIAAAHIDSPRLDLKPVPLYEDSELAYFKTHYYGGIRKYQWVSIPLEVRGTVILRDGRAVAVAIGSGSDPKLVINDLLPHLSDEQEKKSLADGITGEQMNLLVGSEPLTGEEKERVKWHVMKLLYEKYGITEDDFLSAELEVVPAFPACVVGLDGSMIGGYGQDDRVCGYAALRALLSLEGVPAKTAVCVLSDKEEIGCLGVSGMDSTAFDTFLEDLCAEQQVPLRVCLENSFCLSTDVTAAFDPNFDDVFDKRNSARLNHGIGVCKHSGSGGKYDTSDASAEDIAYIRRVFDNSGVIWQTAEWGKVDVGRSSTLALVVARRNIAVVDAGVPLLAMHAPFEISAKLDCYMTFLAIKAILSSGERPRP